MNSFMENLIDVNNYGITENGAIKKVTTKSAVLDMFGLCGAYRNRSNGDCILAFKNALEENETLALKCLFYLRDCRGGQGERRFFRVCYKWLCNAQPEVARRNLELISEYGRWDDLLYATEDTEVFNDAIAIVKKQFKLDLECKTPSLLAKWLPSENASSVKTKKLASKVREAFGVTHKQYRQALSLLRKRINIIERLMSENRWDEIEFSKIPSKAGLIYKNAFARRDIIAKKYETFAKSKDTKVNADTLYPYEIIKKACEFFRYGHSNSDTERAMLEKYWENQIDVLEGKPCKMLCVCDTSASMRGTPLDVAIGLSMYCAERIGEPFKNHYISFSSRPQLIKIEGVDFVDKVQRIYKTNLCENTNIKATFDMLKNAALKANPEDRLDTICIISDMQIDQMSVGRWDSNKTMTEMEKIKTEWEAEGLECPRLVYWNVDARNNTILDAGPDVSFVSGFSPMIFKQILTGETGYSLMEKILMSERYSQVH